MEASVVICTWNRAASLRRVLSCLAEQEAESLRWELVVVDNASTDSTPRVVEEFRSRLALVAVREPKQGLSHARNRGLRTARGDLVIWTDDDVTMGPDWVANYIRGARRFPEATFFGGHILPRFEAPVPPWIQAELGRLGNAFALRDLGTQHVPLARKREPYGANFAIRREAQLAFEYDPELGRVGSALSSGEETNVIYRLLDAGHSGIWLPDVPVHHHISADRLTFRYLFRYRMGIGAAAAQTGRLEPRRKMVREGLGTTVTMPWAILREPASVWVPKMQSAAYSLGQMRVRAPAFLSRHARGLGFRR